MKTLYSLLMALVISAISFSQNANLDREYFNVSYVKLPSKPTLDNSKRTFSSNKRAISLSGFSRVKENGTIDIEYTFNGTNIGEVDIKKHTHEKKDKEGNVTSVSYSYSVSVSYSSSANVSVSNSDVAENDYHSDFSESDNFKKEGFTSYSKAQSYYNNNRYNLRRTHTTKHSKTILNKINGTLNSMYGYVPYTSQNAQFWILGNKKHPEYAKHVEAYESLKATFAKMKYDQPVNELKVEVEPVIEYFKSIVPKYEGPKKKMAKMRYASFYNSGLVYYYLDMPEKVKEYAQKIIDNGYGKSDGKYLNRISDALIERFKINQTDSRHFPVITEDLTNLPEEEVEQPQNNTSNLELIKAYLITKAGDTALADMDTKNVKRIGYEVKTLKYDNNGSPIGSEVKSAKEFKEVLFVDGTHYKNVLFKESSIKGDAVNSETLLSGAAEKLCKVIYESDKINLYLFNEEEPIILLPEADKGKSTLSTKFVFGFKKNLAKLAEGCPALIEKVESKAFKNNLGDLLKFCEALAACE